MLCLAINIFINRYWSKTYGKVLAVVIFVAAVALFRSVLPCYFRCTHDVGVREDYEMVPKLVLCNMITPKTDAQLLVSLWCFPPITKWTA